MIARLVPVSALTDGHKGQWRSLADVAAEPSPFAEAEFVLAAVEHLGSGGDVHLLLAEDADGVAFVLPTLRVPGFRRVRLPALSAWTHDYCFLGSPLVKAGRERDAWAAVLQLLLRDPPAPWLLLPRLPADGPVHAALRQALKQCGVTATPLAPHVRAAACRRPDGTVAPAPLRGVHRKGLRRQRRRMAEHLGAEVVFGVHGADAVLVEDFLRLEVVGWKGRSGTAMSARDRDGDLLRTVAERRPASVEILALRAADRLVAAQVNLRAEPHSYCFKTAYDEDLARYSPGLLLELEVLDWFAADLRSTLLDSCAVPGHSMAERVMPDGRPMTTLLVPLTPLGRLAAVTTPVLARGWSALMRRPMEVP